MKKTLIALAALACASAAFAQSTTASTNTLSGNFGFGVQRTTTPGNKAHLAVTDGSLIFRGSEALDGGLTAAFDLTTDFFRWNGTTGSTNSVATTDVTLSLLGDFGSVRVGQWESVSAAWTFGNVAPIDEMLPVDLYEDGILLQASSRTGRLEYATPDMSGFKFKVVANDLTKDGVKAAGGPEEAATVAFVYANGPLSAALAAKNVNVEDHRQYQVGVSYDFGPVKLGLGVDQGELAATLPTETRDRLGYLASVAAPIGPLTLGATYIQSTLDATATPGSTDLDAAGYAVGANYAFSKRTSINLALAKFDKDYYKDVDVRQGQYRLTMIHNF